jgi:CHAT domain-containing protein/tetratricopeptide (TPR) repeat protein
MNATSTLSNVGEHGAMPRVRFRTAWLVAAGIVAVALLAISFLLRWRDPVRRLAALTPRSERIVEARISGGFAWAPYRGPVRASDQANDPRRMMLGGVAGDLIEAAEKNKTSETQHLAGVARMLTGYPSDAVPVLQEAAQRDPTNARAWNDLAAAQYAAASRDGRASLYPEALASSDRALRLDPGLTEALFNHALVLERIGLTQQAHQAWQRYLTTDPSSQWAEEARTRLGRLPLNTTATLFQRDLPRLEHGDTTVVDSMVKRYPQQTRSWAEAELLGQWGEALARGDAAAADRELTVARNIGDALVRASSERLLHDAVAAIDNAGTAPRARLAAAHVAYRKGRITYSHNQPAAAEPDLRQAAAGFATSGSPMSLVARYFAANTRLDQNDVVGAHSELEGLLLETNSIPEYQALGAQIRWELAVCRMTENDWDGVPLIAGEAAATFARLGELRNLAMMQTISAEALVLLGRLDEAWQARINAFEAESAEGNRHWLAVSVGGSARMELRAGRPGPARALLHIEQEIARAGGHHEFLCAALVREAILSADDRDDADAERLVREAHAIANSIADPAIRAKLTADVQFAEGEATLRQQPRRAIESLNAAMAHYTATNRVFFLPECYLARARAAQGLGDSAGAERDLESGISMLERQPVQLATSISGPVIRDAGPAMFRDAIRLYLDHGDVARAFSYAERSHMTLPGGDGRKVTLPELQRHLTGTSAAVLQMVVLPDEVVVFCVTAGGTVVGHAPVAQHELETLAGRMADVRDDGAARELFALLIRPVENALARVDRVIVVADPLLENVPFAALYDERMHAYLVERLAVMRAVSASSLRDDMERRVPRSVAAIALPPSTTGALATLPAAGQELSEVAQIYPRVTRIAGVDATISEVIEAAAAADVVHLAGHTEREPGIGEAALVLAGGRRMSWRTIAASRLTSRPVVVLAACETLRVPQSAQNFAMSLGGGFLAAGARDVIGTLAPVADNDARQIFLQIHRHLASGLDVASAVRQAQLEALSGAQHQSAWRVVTLLTTHISRSGR